LLLRSSLLRRLRQLSEFAARSNNQRLRAHYPVRVSVLLVCRSAGAMAGFSPDRSIRLIYADSGEPTSGLEPLTCSLRVIHQALQGLARDCKIRVFRALSLPCLAQRCTVLRSRWLYAPPEHLGHLPSGAQAEPSTVASIELSVFLINLVGETVGFCPPRAARLRSMLSCPHCTPAR
jgi:hypothetical protein